MNKPPIDRRKFLAAAGAGALAAIAASKPGEAMARRPNIIYILLDDAGYGDLSCYGQQKFSTPNMDRIAALGLRFTGHYAGSAVCAPSRCSLLTGMHTGHAVIRGNRGYRPEGQTPLPADTLTLPRVLSRAGYRTGMFGKWGLGGPGSTGDPMDQGFDEFFGYNCQSLAHNYYPDHLWHNRERIALDGKTYAHDLIIDHALDFVRQAAPGPFFCYLPVTIPHASLHVPEESARPFRKKFRRYELTPGIYSGKIIRNPAACFAGMMTRLDDQIGQVLDLVASRGLDRDTLIMLSSDNGPHKEGGAVPDFFDSNGPFRGYKRDLYEGGIRVPMIARWTGTITPGQVIDHPSAFWDIFPTMAELAGATPPPGLDGLSLVPLLEGRAADQPRHDYLYWELAELAGRQAIRAGDLKAVRYHVSMNPDAPLELYDLASDPGETRDIAALQPKETARLRDLMASARTVSNEFPLLPDE